ncbi:MAG: hypothetical protein AAF458_11030 [Pseudomonadota bacterium]
MIQPVYGCHVEPSDTSVPPAVRFMAEGSFDGVIPVSKNATLRSSPTSLRRRYFDTELKVRQPGIPRRTMRLNWPTPQPARDAQF